MEKNNNKLREGKELWKEIQNLPKRKVSPKQLQKDLEKIEDET